MGGDENKEHEFGRIIGLNVALLRLCGVIPLEKRLSGRNALAFFAFACLGMYGASYVYQLATNAADLATVLELLTLAISVIGGQTRFTILLWFRGHCQRMLNACEFFWSMLKSQEKDIVRNYANKVTQLTRWYLASCVSTICFYAVFSLFDNSMFDRSDYLEHAKGNGSSSAFPSEHRGFLNATDRDRSLPYSLFFEVQETPWYEIMYVLQLVFMLSVGFTCVGVDMIGPLFILISCGFFEVIRSKIENLHLIDRSSSSSPSSSIAVPLGVTRKDMLSSRQMKSLRICLIHHQMILDFCENIEHLMNVMFLMQLITSTYNISMVGFKLIEDNPDKYKYITQLLIAVIQLFLCNWPADLLLSKSEAIGRAAYQLPWYRYPYSLRKPAIILMIRGQKSVRLTARKFIELSLETFASMISTAASFFTLMRSMN